jgi:hypothetical protein
MARAGREGGPLRTLLILLMGTTLGWGGENPADPTVQAAVAAFYVANDEAQQAVDEVVCGTMRHWRHLDGEALRQVRHVRWAIEAAVLNGGTPALVEFCDWAGER